MRLIQIILFLTLPMTVFAQKTKRVVNKETSETYYVLKSDKSIRHGKYKLLGFGSKLLIEGQYEKGAKEGIWVTYNGKKEIVQKFDYTNHQLIAYAPGLSGRSFTYSIADSSRLGETLSRRPIHYGGGPYYILSVIVSNLRFPLQLAQAGEGGKVLVTITIDKDGNATNHRVENPNNGPLEQEAIRVVQLISNEWLPGEVDGEPVAVDVVIPINFYSSGA